MSEQGALDFISAPAYRQVARREFVLRKFLEHRERFKYVDLDWLQSNWPIWERFDEEARKAARRHGRYSSRTIGEFIRHETALREDAGEFKVNDHVWPDCARLWLALNPDKPEFFETRGRAA